MMKHPLRLLLLSAVVILSGCAENMSYSDLDQYVAEIQAKPMGQIEPMPTFTPYEAFAYKAAGLRSPFEPPLQIKASSYQFNANVRPDESRAKQYLEQFDIETFSMVGSLSNEEGLWALVRGSDGIHRVSIGDYLGKNFGRITYIDDSELRLIEIVPAGADVWIERPRTMRLDFGQP